MGDSQSWRAVALHDGNQAPKSTDERIIAAGHRAAGIELADGTGDGVLAIGASTTTASNFIPVNGIILRGGLSTSGK